MSKAWAGGNTACLFSSHKTRLGQHLLMNFSPGLPTCEETEHLCGTLTSCVALTKHNVLSLCCTTVTNVSHTKRPRKDLRRQLRGCPAYRPRVARYRPTSVDTSCAQGLWIQRASRGSRRDRGQRD